MMHLNISLPNIELRTAAWYLMYEMNALYIDV